MSLFLLLLVNSRCYPFLMDSSKLLVVLSIVVVDSSTFLHEGSPQSSLALERDLVDVVLFPAPRQFDVVVPPSSSRSSGRPLSSIVRWSTGWSTTVYSWLLSSIGRSTRT